MFDGNLFKNKDNKVADNLYSKANGEIFFTRKVKNRDEN